ncbi:MAG: hypothetical protein IJP86_10890 [Synergistaceae bacterium]|nr:hypothetical protein [Synergistaceae bacterium]
MRRLYAAVVLLSALSVLFSASSYADSVLWQRIRLEDAGTVSIPGSWTVLQTNQPPSENAYGRGVFCRLCLAAKDSNASIMLMSYWPFSVAKANEEETARKFTQDMTSEMMRKYGSSGSHPVYGDIRTGGKVAFVSAYRLTENAQTTASFFHGGKIYCLVMTYRPSFEYEATRMMRQIINRWKL